MRNIRQKISRICPDLGTAINKLIDNLPFELHIPYYHYCGAGTKLKKRILRKDVAFNKLDKLCYDHDLVYDKFKDNQTRHEADKTLASQAWKRVKADDSSVSEKIVALIISSAMKTKIGLSKTKKIGKIMKRNRI